LVVRTAGGERKWVRYVSLPQIDEETGKVTGVFGILHDITESRLMRERTEKISQREEEYNRLKTYFLQNISHEIRTPLNAILGFSALISEYPDGADPEHLKEYREIMNDNSDRLLKIIDSVIEMSKIEAGTVKTIRNKVNVNWILLKVYAQFRIDTSLKSVQLVFETPLAEREAYIYTDEFKLTSVLRNLVGNAVKFTAEGRIEFGYSVKDNKIEFYVSDTGIGIPGEYQDVIFREFHQADSSFTRSYGGVGLGLAISKAYVEMLGGKIWVTSEPDKGSVFRFTVPYESGG
jgi:signal transduction histidine kinase